MLDVRRRDRCVCGHTHHEHKQAYGFFCGSDNCACVDYEERKLMIDFTDPDIRHDIGELHRALSFLSYISHQTAVEKGWQDDGVPPINDQLLLAVTEIAEATEELRAGHAPNELRFSDNGKPEGVPSEIADVFIRLAHMCGAHKIDIGTAVVEKLRYNLTRPHRHGGKRF